jgi:murein DD-endopeptidase MepM/ murein hydrolase activator NlpD
LHRIAVKKGDIVNRGDIIGYVGNTGRSTGPHLHYEVRRHNKPVNPLAFIAD